MIKLGRDRGRYLVGVQCLIGGQTCDRGGIFIMGGAFDMGGTREELFYNGSG